MKARVPKGFGSTQSNMQGMLRQAQKMQEDITNKQSEIDVMEFKSSTGGGVVEVVIGGDKVVKSIVIKPEIVDPNEIEMLEDLVLGAVNEAIRQVEDLTNAEMEKITNGINLPGLY